MAWLKGKVRELKNERVALITKITLLEWLQQQLVAKRRTVRHKEYLGDLPVKRQRITPELYPGHYFPKGRIHPPPPIEDQWYDPVEELDQTHADRQLELANELVQLPPFTFYCRTATAQHHVALLPPAQAVIDEPRIEHIRQASKARFGRPPGSPELSAPVQAEEAGGALVSSRIGRQHSSEE